MRILIDIGHPAHVHLFKNAIWNLRHKGYEVKITARNKEITLYLLNVYGFEYELVGEVVKELMSKGLGIIKGDYKLYKVAKEFRPDIFVSMTSPYAAHVSWVLRKPHITFNDTEVQTLINWMTYPFTEVICTPSCYKGKVNPKKHVKYEGYHELAYLHPNYYKPDPSILEYLGLSESDVIIQLRFSSKDSSHDIGVTGFDLKNREKLMSYFKTLERYGDVFYTSETKLGKEFDKYLLKIPVNRIHDLLAYTTLYIGEGATMASEAGVLGVPWIFVSNQTRGYLEDQEKNYGLGYIISDPEQAIEKAVELLESDNLKNEWQKKKAKLLNEKIDVTKFMTEFIENYLESFYGGK